MQIFDPPLFSSSLIISHHIPSRLKPVIGSSVFMAFDEKHLLQDTFGKKIDQCLEQTAQPEILYKCVHQSCLEDIAFSVKAAYSAYSFFVM